MINLFSGQPSQILHISKINCGQKHDQHEQEQTDKDNERHQHSQPWIVQHAFGIQLGSGFHILLLLEAATGDGREQIRVPDLV